MAEPVPEAPVRAAGEYRFVLDFRERDGAPLGRVPIRVDWAPAREWVLFEAARRGRPLDDAGSFAVRPHWHPDLGEPYVSGVRVEVRTCSGFEAFHDFTTTYFHSHAEAATAALVEAGILPEGRATAFYFVAAYPAEPPAADETGRKIRARCSFVAIEPEERPVADFLSASLPMGEGEERDVPVFFPWAVIAEARNASRASLACETGGILLGRLHRDPGSRDLYVVVSAQLAVASAEATSTRLTFTSETWARAREALGRRRGNELMVGWWHSHPQREWCKSCPPEKKRGCRALSGLFSAEDRLLHRTAFPRPFGIALVVTETADDSQVLSLYGWRRGRIEPRGFRLFGAPCSSPAPPAAQGRKRS